MIDSSAFTQTRIATSPYDSYCVGYGHPKIEGDGYLLGLMLGVGLAKESVDNQGSANLDGIVAFDRAEVETTNLGQINAITVSSFCGPEGRVFGLDLAATPQLRKAQLFQSNNIPVYSAQPLIDAATKLWGTVAEKAFPFLPGSHVPAAMKDIVKAGPTTIYSAIGIGIPTDRTQAACLLMEDVGELRVPTKDTSILEWVADSIVEVGKNQNVQYVEIFTAVRQLEVPSGKVGCALVMAPYFAIAQKGKKRLAQTSSSNQGVTA